MGRGRQRGSMRRRAVERGAVVAALAARRVGLCVERSPRAPGHHSVIVVGATHRAHQREVHLESRQVRERVVVRLHVPAVARKMRSRVLPPRERLLSDRMRNPVARAHEDDIAVSILLVTDGKPLRGRHAIAHS